MRPPRLLAAAVFAAGIAVLPAAAQHQAVSSKEVQRRVDRATVVLTPGICAGVIVVDARHAITAAHCLRDSRQLEVELHDGTRRRARVVQLDRGRDVALLEMSEPAAVEPLGLATAMPRPGEALYFGGRRDRQGSHQVFAVLRIGACPSLPQVPDAIFTNLRAKPGDSGAPMVNRNLEVVALVHGGVTCNIAAPVVGIGAALGLAG
jgi:S1-C subfamily serine protease